MIFLDPINAITSIQFYKRAATFAFGRSLLFLGYLTVLFTVFSCVAARVRLFPAMDSTFRWLETSMPVLTFSNGKVSSPTPGPITLRHPDPAYDDLSFVVHTQRTEVVTPKEMEAAAVKGYLANDAFYLLDRGGAVSRYDFAKAATAHPTLIGPPFYRQASVVLQKLLIPITAIIAALFFLIWKTASTFFYSILALILGSAARSQLGYGAMVNIALYAQSLVVVLQIIFLFMPRGIPFFGFLGPLATGIYIWLAIKATSEAPAPAS